MAPSPLNAMAKNIFLKISLFYIKIIIYMFEGQIIKKIKIEENKWSQIIKCISLFKTHTYFKKSENPLKFNIKFEEKSCTYKGEV